MELIHSPNTCSMTELARIYANTEQEFKTRLAELVKQATGNSRQMIVANMHEHIHEQYGKLLKAEGFEYIGRYKGNSSPYVYTWMFGIERPKPAPLARIRKAVVRRKPLAR